MCWIIARIDKRLNDGGVCRREDICNEISEIPGVLKAQPLDMKIGKYINHVAAEINKKEFRVSDVVEGIKEVGGVIATKIIDGTDWEMTEQNLVP